MLVRMTCCAGLVDPSCCGIKVSAKGEIESVAGFVAIPLRDAVWVATLF